MNLNDFVNLEGLNCDINQIIEGSDINSGLDIFKLINEKFLVAQLSIEK